MEGSDSLESDRVERSDDGLIAASWNENPLVGVLGDISRALGEPAVLSRRIESRSVSLGLSRRCGSYAHSTPTPLSTHAVQGRLASHFW